MFLNPAFAKDNPPPGFKFSQIKKGGLYDRLGLKNDDILLKINGITLKSLDELSEAMKKAGGSVRLEIYRNGKTEVLTYKIK